jgi:hypothetical protein
MSITARRMLAVALAASVAAGCGQGTASSSSKPPPSGKASAKTLLAAATATTKTGSARYTLHMTIAGANGQTTAQGHGVTSFSHPVKASISMVMQIPGAATPMAVTERVLGTTIYMKMPALQSAIPGAKPWMKLDLEAMGKAHGIDFGALMNSSSNDPATILSYLQGVSSNIQNAGSETVDGVQTTHYKATVDFRRVMAALGRKDPKAAASIRQVMAMSGETTEPVEVWIDDQGLLRQETVHSRMPSLGASMTFTMDLSDFGTAVDVTAPPASQTSDFMKLLRQAQSSSAGGA